MSSVKSHAFLMQDLLYRRKMKITLTPTEFIDFFQVQLLKQDLIFSSIFFNKILLSQNEIYLSAAGWDFFRWSRRPFGPTMFI